MSSHTDPTMSSLNVYDPLNPLTTLSKRDPFGQQLTDPFGTDVVGWPQVGFGRGFGGGMMNPFSAVDNALQPFRSMMGSDMIPSSMLTQEQRSLTNIMNSDLIESPSEYRVVVNLPGVTPDDLNVEVRENPARLVIRGHIDQHHDEETDNLVRKERHHGDVTRTIPLPTNCRMDDITTSMFNGVLTITAPKLETSNVRTRKLPIIEGTGPKAKGNKKGGRGN